RPLFSSRSIADRVVAMSSSIGDLFARGTSMPAKNTAIARYVHARHLGGESATGERRQVRVRVPHDSKDTRLRFHGLRAQVRRRWPTRDGVAARVLRLRDASELQVAALRSDMERMQITTVAAMLVGIFFSAPPL